MDGSTPAPRWTRHQLTLWTLAALPFLLAVAGQVFPARVTRIADAPARPPLAFDQYTVNFHDVALRPVIDAYFQFTNRSDHPVQITKIDPSCGCITPRLYDGKKDYAPGERGRFTVGVKTDREQAGPKEYVTRVEYVSEGKTYEETLALRMVLPKQKVTVEPAEVYFYQLTGQPDSRTIHVVDTRGGRLEVTAAKISSPHAQVEVGKLEVDEEGRRRYPIRIDVAGDVPPGRNIAVITITTSDAEFDSIKVPVLIQGPSSGVVPASGEEAGPRRARSVGPK